MKTLQNSRSRGQIQTQLTRNQHVDIFNTKNSNSIVIKNNQPVVIDNVFQKKSEEAYNKYQESIKRPASSHGPKNAIKEDKYTFDSDWSNPKFEFQKTLVNENANFSQDYHQQRKLEMLASSIFVDENQKNQLKRIYKKFVPEECEKTQNPIQKTHFGRKDIIKNQYDNQNADKKKVIPNYSNLFGIGDRINAKSSQQLPIVQPQLIPNQMKWEEFDSVLQRGCKDEDVTGDFHKKRYYQNMKSSMDTHNNYLNYMPPEKVDQKTKQKKSPITNNITLQQKPSQKLIEVSEVLNNQNNQKLANGCILEQPHTHQTLKNNIKNRPQSATKPSKQVEIVILKGLTSKFNLAALGNQCRLHSLLLVQFNNTINQTLNSGRGSIIVVPQKKFGLENLCSWLKSQGLAIKLK